MPPRIPTSMVDSMNPVVALALAGQDTASQKANGPLPPTPNTRKESVAAPQAAETWDPIIATWLVHPHAHDG